VPSALPIADPAPADGLLPASAAGGALGRDFGVYLHVPFCRVRCGYCDFNTYTADELRGARRDDYAGEAVTEVRQAAAVLRASGVPDRPVATVFVGGGTPTLLPVDDLAAMLHAVDDAWGLAPGAEVTTEANPDSIDAAGLRRLAEAGYTRVSVGMQSAVPHVLATLDRTHDPRNVPVVVAAARDAGLQVSVDLIYGTPGESLDDWRRSLDAALAMAPDHISAYALIVEDGTQLARRIRRGEIAAPDDDLHADMYEAADAAFAAAGYGWYEVSNWSTGVDTRSRHNLSYWTSQDWWGVGPGAHSHVGGTRWWNVKHPAAYASRLHEGVSPAAGREELDAGQRAFETLLLRTRTSDGLPIVALPDSGRAAVAGLIADGLVDGRRALGGTLVPTLRGRLLADAIVRRLSEN
jgi:putative oxygen-independent coproporphyrinogen III oxidase